MGVQQSELEDASQEVFLVVHRCLEQFEGRAKFTTWLFRICFHVASDRRRRGRQRREVLSDALLAERADHAPDAEALAQRRRDLESGASFNLGWVGKGADLYPEHKTGVEAAHAAAKMRVDAIERSLSK